MAAWLSQTAYSSTQWWRLFDASGALAYTGVVDIQVSRETGRRSFDVEIVSTSLLTFGHLEVDGMFGRWSFSPTTLFAGDTLTVNIDCGDML